MTTSNGTPMLNEAEKLALRKLIDAHSLEAVMRALASECDDTATEVEVKAKEIEAATGEDRNSAANLGKRWRNAEAAIEKVADFLNVAGL